jgi:ribosomal protein S27AE
LCGAKWHPRHVPLWVTNLNAGTVACESGVMPLPQKFDPANPPLGQRRCPKCGLPLFLSCIKPSDQDDHDQRTFECSKCAYAETVIVNFR